MKKFTIQALALVVVMLIALAYATAKLPVVPFTHQQTKQSELKVGDTYVKIEVADTPSKRQKGLGGRESLASDSGMLFVFQETKKYNFWMKDTKFPLDLIWIRSGVVVDILKKMVPPMPGQADETLPIYTSNETVDMALEVNSGFVDQHGIKVGDKIELNK